MYSVIGILTIFFKFKIINCRRFKRRYFKTSYTPKEKQRLMEKESKKPNKSIDFEDDDSTEDGDGEEPDDDVATEV